MKKITTRQFAAIKRVAQNVNPLVQKKHKLEEKMEEMSNEIMNLSQEIDGHEMGIEALTGGYSSEDLIRREVTPTGETNEKGQPIKVTKWVPTELMIYSEEENCYYVEDLVKPVENAEVDESSSLNMVAASTEHPSVVDSMIQDIQ